MQREKEYSVAEKGTCLTPKNNSSEQPKPIMQLCVCIVCLSLYTCIQYMSNLASKGAHHKQRVEFYRLTLVRMRRCS